MFAKVNQRPPVRYDIRDNDRDNRFRRRIPSILTRRSRFVLSTWTGWTPLSAWTSFAVFIGWLINNDIH